MPLPVDLPARNTVLQEIDPVALGFNYVCRRCDVWGRIPAGANLAVLVSFVLPEILIAVALLFVATVLTTPLQLGTTGQVIGLVTYQISYPVVIVRARLLTIGRDYEEAAIDLGASPLAATRRVLIR